MKQIRIREWKDLHPAPRSEVPAKECCSCLFFQHGLDPAWDAGLCKLTNKPTGNYDECGAFTKRQVNGDSK